MHFLHAVLVHVPDVSECKFCDETEKVNAVREYAVGATEKFYGDVFDWRETNSAGRWANEYPENVIFAEDDVDVFVNKLRNLNELQKKSAFAYLEQLKNVNLSTLTENIFAAPTGSKPANPDITMFTPYCLLKLAELLYGNYNSDSHFYNTESYTSRIDEACVNGVRENPGEWALVFFDYHN